MRHIGHSSFCPDTGALDGVGRLAYGGGYAGGGGAAHGAVDTGRGTWSMSGAEAGGMAGVGTAIVASSSSSSMFIASSTVLPAVPWPIPLPTSDPDTRCRNRGGNGVSDTGGPLFEVVLTDKDGSEGTDDEPAWGNPCCVCKALKASWTPINLVISRTCKSASGSRYELVDNLP